MCVVVLLCYLCKTFIHLGKRVITCWEKTRRKRRKRKGKDRTAYVNGAKKKLRTSLWSYKPLILCFIYEHNLRTETGKVFFVADLANSLISPAIRHDDFSNFP